MPISPRKLEIGNDEGFNGNDIFNLKPFGERLALIVEQNDEPAVIAIDGEWGSGKSVFAKQWAGLLRQRNTPVIEFDAFANDYHEDAFIALASEIIAYAKAVRNGEEYGVIKTFIDRTARIGRALLPLTAKVGIKAATLGVVDPDMPSYAMKKMVEAIAADAGNFLEKELTDRLNKAESTSAMMKSFGAALGELAAKLAQWENPDAKAEDVKPRLVVIIDELDRCKPSFALDLLEKIKHFYNVDGVSFVLVTNLQQIEAAVEGRYGAKTDAAAYLQKFITVRFKWNPRNEADHPISVGYVDQCLKAIRPNLNNHHIKLLKFLCERASSSLRTVERVCSYICLHPDIIIDSRSQKSTNTGNILLTLILLKEIGVNYFNYKDKSAFYREATQYLPINKNSNYSIEREVFAYLMIAASKDYPKTTDDATSRCLMDIRNENPDPSAFHRRIERLLNGEAVG